MGASVSSTDEQSNSQKSQFQAKYSKLGVNDKEFERIYQAYKDLLLYSAKYELVSKRKLRKSHFITRLEYEAICNGNLRQFMIDQLNPQYFHNNQSKDENQNSSQDAIELNDHNDRIFLIFFILNKQQNEPYQNRFQENSPTKGVNYSESPSKNYQYFTPDHHNNQDHYQGFDPAENDLKFEEIQKIDQLKVFYSSNKYDSHRGNQSLEVYSCSTCSNADSDEVSLSFQDFFDLMSSKIIQQKRESQLNTVYESKAENVSCIIWPTLKSKKQKQVINNQMDDLQSSLQQQVKTQSNFALENNDYYRQRKGIRVYDKNQSYQNQIQQPHEINNNVDEDTQHQNKSYQVNFGDSERILNDEDQEASPSQNVVIYSDKKNLKNKQFIIEEKVGSFQQIEMDHDFELVDC